MQSDTLKAVDAENPSEVAKRLAGYSRATRESWTHLLTGARVDGYARQQYLSGYASAVIDFGAEAAHYATLDSATRKQIVRQFVDAEYGEGISVNIEVRRMGEDDLKDAAQIYNFGDDIFAGEIRVSIPGYGVGFYVDYHQLDPNEPWECTFNWFARG